MGGGGAAARALNRAAAAVTIEAGCEHIVLLGHTVTVDAPLKRFVTTLLEPLSTWCTERGCRELPPAATELREQPAEEAGAAVTGLVAGLIARVDGVVAHAGYELALAKNPAFNQGKKHHRASSKPPAPSYGLSPASPAAHARRLSAMSLASWALHLNALPLLW